ncbi:MAPEG family protein [Novosphingobium guangzhouense]|uniref:GST-like protein n=1 Tax=Novosphingobium guangzhouense TaxID=1850347 RepID=A0A2K2G1Z1_9SPHN|nr:MAPEG family protein [Novosphingobium guangzhouense]PNU05051.1 GST-like protein [Novosphingobium guangzhouense]
MILQTTLSMSAAAGLIALWLAVRTGKARMSAKVWHGDGENPVLLRRMRAQANYGESAPFVLILVAAIEFSGKGGAEHGNWLAIVGGLYMLARIAHGIGMDKPEKSPLRAAGFIISALTLLGLALTAVLIAAGRF